MNLEAVWTWNGPIFWCLHKLLELQILNSRPKIGIRNEILWNNKDRLLSLKSFFLKSSMDFLTPFSPSNVYVKKVNHHPHCLGIHVQNIFKQPNVEFCGRGFSSLWSYFNSKLYKTISALQELSIQRMQNWVNSDICMTAVQHTVRKCTSRRSVSVPS